MQKYIKPDAEPKAAPELPSGDAISIIREIASIDAAADDHKAALKDLRDRRKALWSQILDIERGQKTIDLRD